MRKIPLEVALYDNVYGGVFPDNQYYVILFDAIPSRFSTKNIYSKLLINEIKNMGFVEECRIVTAKRNFDKMSESLYVNMKNKIFISVQNNFSKDTNLITIEFHYNILLGELEKQLDMSVINKHQMTPKKSSIQLVKSDMGHLDTEEYDLTIPELDLELNYGKDFVKIHNTIVTRLYTDSDKGIILLHGDPGTGKCVVGKTKITLRNKITGEIFSKNIEDLM